MLKSEGLWFSKVFDGRDYLYTRDADAGRVTSAQAGTVVGWRDTAAAESPLCYSRLAALPSELRNSSMDNRSDHGVVIVEHELAPRTDHL